MLQRLISLVVATQFCMATGIVGHASSWSLSALGALAGLAAWRPTVALLLAAFVGPLGGAFAAVFGAPPETAERVLSAVVAGWLVGRAARGTPLADTTFAGAALLAMAVAGTSAIVGVGVSELSWQPPDHGPKAWLAWIAADIDAPHSPTRQALRFALGMALAVACGETCRTSRLRTPMTATVVVALSAVAMLSVIRLVEVVWRSPEPLSRLVEVLGTVRISPVIPDANAMGAVMLLGAPLALAMAWQPGWRWLGAVSLPLLLAANWLAGSRTTLLMTPLVLAALSLVLARARASRRVTLALTATVVFVYGALALAGGGERYGQLEGAWTVRRDFVVVTKRMVEEAPLTGIGIGQYRRRSTEFMPPTLRGQYAAENAHNQFLQVLGELGVVGLTTFAGVILLGLAPVASGVMRSSPHEAGLAVAALAFVLTWPTQHPLLVFDVAVAFWAVLGLVRSTHQVRPPRTSRATTIALAAATLVLLASTPYRVWSGIAARDMSEQFRGFSTWREDTDGGYRESTSGGTLFVDGRAQRCLVPLRARGVDDVALATISVDGRSYGTIRVARGLWQRVPLMLPSTPPQPWQFHRIDIEWEPPNRRSRLDLGDLECADGPLAHQ